jgi:hypothetical protein
MKERVLGIESGKEETVLEMLRLLVYCRNLESLYEESSEFKEKVDRRMAAINKEKLIKG